MPIAIDFTVSLAFVVALLVSFGLLYAWRGIGKPILLSFALLFNVVSVPWIRGSKHPFGFIAAWLENAAEVIDHSLAQLVLNCEKGIVGLWHAMAVQVRLLGRLLGDLAETIESRWRALLLSIPPVALLWLAVRAARQLPAVWKAIGRAEHAIAHTATRVIHDAAKVTNVTKTYVTKKVYEAAPAVAKAVTAPLPWINHRFRGIDETLKETLALAQRNARLLTAAGVGALVLAALPRLGLKWIRCPSLHAIDKKHGCSPWRALEHLLAPALDILVFIDICVVASLIRRAATEARPVLNELLVGVDAALCKGRRSPPPDLRLRAVALPPVVAPLEL